MVTLTTASITAIRSLVCALHSSSSPAAQAGNCTIFSATQRPRQIALNTLAKLPRPISVNTCNSAGAEPLATVAEESPMTELGDTTRLHARVPGGAPSSLPARPDGAV